MARSGTLPDAGPGVRRRTRAVVFATSHGYHRCMPVQGRDRGGTVALGFFASLPAAPLIEDPGDSQPWLYAVMAASCVAGGFGVAALAGRLALPRAPRVLRVGVALLPALVGMVGGIVL